MFTKNTSRARIARLSILLTLAATLLLAMAGCDDDDDPVSSQEDHFEAVGFLIYASGVPVLDYFGPDYGPGDNVANLDTLFASQGLNPRWDSKFYNEDTVEINPPSGSEQTLAAVFADPIAELWWHAGEEGQFEDFHLRGLAAGTTTVEFRVMHAGHSDFTTLPIPIIVDTSMLHGEPEGIILEDEDSGTELARALLVAEDSVTGSLAVSVNDSTDHIEVIFFDESGTEFWPDESEHSITINVANTGIATVSGLDPMEPFAFKLVGQAAGATTVTIELLHQSSVEATFTAIPVNVN